MVECVKFLVEQGHCKANYWLNLLILKDDFINERNNLITDLGKTNIMVLTMETYAFT